MMQKPLPVLEFFWGAFLELILAESRWKSQKNYPRIRLVA